MVGRNNSISVSFLIMGHTKFAPDWCFGLLKRAFRRRRVGYLDIVRVVEESAEVNHAQLVGAHDGTVIVPTYDWAGYFDPFFKGRLSCKNKKKLCFGARMAYQGC